MQEACQFVKPDEYKKKSVGHDMAKKCKQNNHRQTYDIEYLLVYKPTRGQCHENIMHYTSSRVCIIKPISWLGIDSINLKA